MVTEESGVELGGWSPQAFDEVDVGFDVDSSLSRIVEIQKDANGHQNEASRPHQGGWQKLQQFPGRGTFALTTTLIHPQGDGKDTLSPPLPPPHPHQYREEASVQAEECASRALSSASRAAEAMDLRVRTISDRLETATVRQREPTASFEMIR